MKGNGHPTNNQNISEYVALLYQKYSHKLYCNAFHYTSNPSIAEDGVQQIFEKILYILTQHYMYLNTRLSIISLLYSVM
mgnify:FL=1